MRETDELESLRHQVREVTAEIIQSTHERTKLAKQIGEIKRRLGIDVKDEKVEQEIRLMVLSLAEKIGMGGDFALQLLNVLLTESEQVQAQRRHQKNQSLTHLAIFMKAKQLEASGKEIVHMEVGEPDYPAPVVVGESLTQAFKLREYHYTDTRGIPKLRDAIAKRERVSEDNVIVTPGGRFAIFSSITSLLKAGQELIVIEPAWPAYKEGADFVDAKTKTLRTTLKNRWTPDLKKLEEMVNPSTKMIVLNYPNNPTGKILDAKAIEKIISIAKDNELYLLSDEVYADYAFKKFTSIRKFGYDRSILVSSFSKRYAMTGFRVGYGIASKDIIARMSKLQAAAITSVAEPMQRAAMAAMSTDPSENVMLMKKRLDFVSYKLKEMSLRFVEPEGAMYVYPELPKGDDIALVEKLLQKEVAIAPGSGFGEYYKQFVRLSACQPEKTLEKGLAIMASTIKELV